VNESQIFTNAVKLASPAERAAYLDEACAGNPQLRADVEALLHAHASDPGFLEQPAGSLAGTADEAAAAGPSSAPRPEPDSAWQPGVALAGRYRLLEVIGEGGMGSVWMAQQTVPVKRLVAVKLIKPGMDSREVLARFEAERQALALMDHPHIAKVLDAGAAPDGRPFFVMELVKGVPITRYCDAHHLTPRQRLELFVPVCQAIQHAHHKGVIHRDVKPSNVLIALYDDQPVPKVIDFGVAKAAGQQLTEQTLHTGFGAVVGTVEYMSPEQASFNQLDVDTRSDIYALGVLLYELLAGSPPFTRKELEKAGVLEMLRVIREQEPTTPSAKLSTAEGLPSLAANRGTEPRRLTALVRGELDWITMKCLEKDRNRRYETANALARDIERYLHDEPVQTGPPSAWYRFRKFARRNKRSLATVTVVALAVLLVIGTLGWAARDRAARQHEAERAVTAALAQAETLLAEGDKQIDHPERWRATTRLARLAVEKAEEVLATGAATKEMTGRVRQVRDAVDAAVTDSRLLVELDRIRLEQAAFVKDDRFDRGRAAPLYAKALGDYGVDVAAPEAAAARVRASRLREALLAALQDWARVTREEGARQRLEAVLQAVEPPDAFRTRWQAAARRGDKAALVQLATEPQVQQLPAAAIVHLGQDLADVKEWAAAERLLRAAQERKPADFWLNHDLGNVLDSQGPARVEEAIGYLRAALALRSDSPGVYLNLGVALSAKGDLDGALRYYQAALQIDPDYAMGHNDVGTILHKKGQLDQAIAEYREALRLKRDHPVALRNLGHALSKQGMLNEAIACYREAIKIKKDLPEAHNSLGVALMDKGQLEKAIAEFHEAIRLKPDFTWAYVNLGGALIGKGRLDEAIAACQTAIRLKEDYADAHYNLGLALFDKRLLDAAIAAFQQAIAIEKDHAKAHCSLGNALKDKGQLDEAIAACQKAIALQPDLVAAYSILGCALTAKGDLPGAIAACQKAIALRPDYAEAHRNLGNAIRATGDLPGAIAAYRAAIAIGGDGARAHSDLGIALRRQGKLDEAIAAYREAIGIKKDYAEAHCNLGKVLRDKGRLDEAIEAYREAIRLKPGLVNAHVGLGALLCDCKRDYDGAIAAFKEAIRLEPDDPRYHHNLGNALKGKGRLDEAIACYREAIRLKKDLPEPHFQVGLALLEQGQFPQAVEELRLGHQLGSQDPRQPNRDAQWLRNAERMVELDAKLAKVLRGEIPPVDAGERAQLGWLCQQPYKLLNAAAARFYAEAFAAEPKLTEDLGTGHRYNAACAAALAGCGQGKDAGKLDDQQRARLRRQALTWLRADLMTWHSILEKDPNKAGPAVLQQMQHWQGDTDFVGVRGPDGIARLPEAERPEWHKLWEEVAALGKRAAGSK
jgi:tetratricopeptide (TPR) repeat protein/serine/threonine protein kinase